MPTDSSGLRHSSWPSSPFSEWSSPLRSSNLYVFRREHANSWDEAITLNRIIFPYLFFLGLAALGMGILNSFHNFAVASLHHGRL